MDGAKCSSFMLSLVSMSGLCLRVAALFSVHQPSSQFLLLD